jgi:hypothetical protein
VDISPIAVINAKLVQQPSIDASGRLHLTGFFPSRPEQVNFDVSFEMVDGRWRLSALALNTTLSEPPATTGAITPEAPLSAGRPPEAAMKPAGAVSDRPPEAATEPPGAVSDSTKTRVENKPATAPASDPASAALPDIRDEVDSLETSPARRVENKPATAPASEPASAALPDIRDEVDSLETSPARRKAQTPPPQPTNPFAGY